MTLAGCGHEASSKPPQLDLPALTLHVCLPSEPNHDGPCSDEALENCPVAVTRARCLATALDQLAAEDEFAARPPSRDGGLPLAAAAGIVAATLGAFTLLGWGISRGTARRNRQAFETELPLLETMGFTQPPVSMPFPPIRTVGSVRRSLVRDGAAPVWLIESEHVGLTVNGMPARRYAVVQLERLVPAGRLLPAHRVVAATTGGFSEAADYVSTFGPSHEQAELARTLRVALGPLFPQVTTEVEGPVVMVSVTARANRASKTPPVSLAALADAAIAISDTWPAR